MLTLKEWQQKFKNINNLIVQASVMNGSDSWQPFPIGMQYNYIYNYSKGPKLQIGNHDKTVLCAINIGTDKRRRPYGLNRELFVNNLNKNGITNSSLSHTEYFEQLPQTKFVISPEGNGIDCHRHYEALIAGCIPIIEYNPLIQEKYKGCPILYTKDYSEITEEYLLEKYNEMLDIKYDFNNLFLSSYEQPTQNYIKTCGNYWTKRFTNEIFYK